MWSCKTPAATRQPRSGVLYAVGKAWSPLFNGRAVAALAADPAIIEKTGRALDALGAKEAFAAVANDFARH
jgi:hypothetical protein